MLFRESAMAMSLAVGRDFTLDLGDPDACRLHMRRMGWAVDRLPEDILDTIRERAVEYRRAIPSILGAQRAPMRAAA